MKLSSRYPINRPIHNVIAYQKNQQGVALLTILLLVVAITVVAGSMIASQRLMMRQYNLLLTQDQLLQDVLTGQQLAVALIQTESQVNNTDSVEDAWAKPQPPYQIEGHHITINIRDEAGRFNLNNLYHNGHVDMVALGVMQRLLTQLGLDSNLAYTLVDWQDPDNQLTTSEGLETALYTTADGTGISNQPFISVDGLRNVSGFDADSARLLAPYVTALPYFVPINVNTADPLLLSALSPADDEGNQEQSSASASSLFMQDNEPQIFESVEIFLASLPQLNPSSDESDDGLSKQNNGQGEQEGGEQEGASGNQDDERNSGQAGGVEEPSPESGRNRQALAKLLSVDSQAFAVLIDVTVADTDKHRYATSYVSKITAPLNPLPSNNNNNNNPSQPEVTQIDSNTPRIIQAFGSRLWTYRPNF